MLFTRSCQLPSDHIADFELQINLFIFAISDIGNSHAYQMIDLISEGAKGASTYFIGSHFLPCKDSHVFLNLKLITQHHFPFIVHRSHICSARRSILYLISI